MSPSSTKKNFWLPLIQELDEWAIQGMTASFWMRDDDAIALTPQLQRLVSVATSFKIEIGLAVIPARLTDQLSTYLLSGESPFYPMCHGWRHVNYGSPQRPSEFGRERPTSMLIEDAKSAYAEFVRRFGKHEAVFVPPFARIADELVPELPKLGFFGVSTGPTAAERRLSRLCSQLKIIRPLWFIKNGSVPRLDVHIDPFDWPKGRARGSISLTSELVGYLRLRRLGVVRSEAPIGLLMHHLKFDDGTWNICGELLNVLVSHRAVAWPSVREIAARSVKPAGFLSHIANARG